MAKAKLLYVEDEPTLAQVVKEGLDREGYEVFHYAQATPALHDFQSLAPDLAILDIMLPDMDGYALCRAIRAIAPSLPIIFLTAKVEVEDLVEGFAAGGTDYLRKPFSMQELTVRIENQLRMLNSSRAAAPTGSIAIGSYSYLPEQYLIIAPSGDSQRLSLREHELLMLLAQSEGAVVQRQDILLALWGDDSFFNSRSLDVYIRRLRQLLADDPTVEIVTLRGRGYLLNGIKDS